MTPLVTVYITNYNYGAFIKMAIESVLNQTLQDFELLIIDDGSTDNSHEIIDSYKHDKKITTLYQHNKGLNITNNVALERAKGKYIIRLDADDYFDSRALEIMTSELEADPDLGLIFPDYYLIDSNGTILGKEQRHKFNKDVSMFDQPAHGACTMIRKKFLENVNGYDERYNCQDGYELWIKFINHYKVDNINQALFYYRQHGRNLTTNEELILETRARIKNNYLIAEGQKFITSTLIIPIRETLSDENNLAYSRINGEYLLDIKLKYLSASSRISKIVIMSPDKNGRDVYKGIIPEAPIEFQERSLDNTGLNTGLEGLVDEFLSKNFVQDDAIIISTLEFPFISEIQIQEALDSLQIFAADAVISVRPDQNMFFKHDGSGMKPILDQQKFTKLERNIIYRHIGGITSFLIEPYRKRGKIISGAVTHIVLPQKAAHGIFSNFDVKIAEAILNQQG